MQISWTGEYEGKVISGAFQLTYNNRTTCFLPHNTGEKYIQCELQALSRLEKLPRPLEGTIKQGDDHILEIKYWNSVIGNLVTVGDHLLLRRCTNSSQEGALAKRPTSICQRLSSPLAHGQHNGKQWVAYFSIKHKRQHISASVTHFNSSLDDVESFNLPLRKGDQIKIHDIHKLNIQKINI